MHAVDVVEVPTALCLMGDWEGAWMRGQKGRWQEAGEVWERTVLLACVVFRHGERLYDIMLTQHHGLQYACIHTANTIAWCIAKCRYMSPFPFCT